MGTYEFTIALGSPVLHRPRGGLQAMTRFTAILALSSCTLIHLVMHVAKAAI